MSNKKNINNISKKKKIPSALRTAVWNYYNGKIYEASCYTGCGEIISAHNFECGHVIAESKNGTTELSNLRPICSNCNKSMGNNNMNEFTKKYGFKKINVKNKTKKHDIDMIALDKKNVSDLTYRELQYICKKNKIRSNMGRNKLESIVTDLRDKKDIDKKFLSAKHPNYNNNIIDNIISNTYTFFKICANILEK